jgi:hypothetical protein
MLDELVNALLDNTQVVRAASDCQIDLRVHNRKVLLVEPIPLCEVDRVKKPCNNHSLKFQTSGVGYRSEVQPASFLVFVHLSRVKDVVQLVVFGSDAFGCIENVFCNVKTVTGQQNGSSVQLRDNPSKTVDYPSCVACRQLRGSG